MGGFRSATMALAATAVRAGGTAPLDVDAETAPHRRLGEFGTFAGYEPTTEVTKWAILDRDQRSLEERLRAGTPESFRDAAAVYSLGGHAGSYAVLDLDRPVSAVLEPGEAVTGLATAGGKDAKGTIVGNYFGDERSVNVLYHVPKDPDDVAPNNMCMVGGLKEFGEEMTKGCYNETGTLTVANRAYKYHYDVLADTYGHITLSSLSIMAMRQMYRISDECLGCPYPEYVQYHEYYQDMAYGNHWIQGALSGTKVTYLGRGDADFTGMSLKARADAIKKGSVYLNVFMYVLRNMRLAVAECQRPCVDACDPIDDGCVACGDRAAAAWDRAAALYVGSLQTTGEGQFLYHLAEARCRDFRTCGEAGDEPVGTASVNLRIAGEFASGQRRVASGACNRAEAHLDRIWQLMAVPLVQGTLRYAHKLDGKTARGASEKDLKEKHNAEGATFAAAVLPKVFGCNPDDAEVLYGNMRIGATYTDFATVKAIFEANYDCLGIACADVGGLYDADAGAFFAGAEPCTGTGAAATARSSGSKSVAGIVLGSMIVAVAAVIGLLWCERRLNLREERATAENQLESSDGFSSERGEEKKEKDDDNDGVYA